MPFANISSPMVLGISSAIFLYILFPFCWSIVFQKWPEKFYLLHPE